MRTAGFGGVDEGEQVAVAVEEGAVGAGLQGDAAHADRGAVLGGAVDGALDALAARRPSAMTVPMRGMPSITLRLRRTTATASPIRACSSPVTVGAHVQPVDVTSPSAIRSIPSS